MVNEFYEDPLEDDLIRAQQAAEQRPLAENVGDDETIMTRDPRVERDRAAGNLGVDGSVQRPRNSDRGSASGAAEVYDVDVADIIPPRPRDAHSEVATAEREPEARQVRITALNKEPGPKGSPDLVNNRPEKESVVDAARAGETQRLTIVRRTPGGSTEFWASPSLVPQDATVQRSTDSHQPDAGRPEEEFRYWARITATRAKPTADNKQQGSDQADGLSAENFLLKSQDPVAIVVEAEEVPTRVQEAVLSNLRRDLHYAEQLKTRQGQVPELQKLIGDISSAQETALVRRTVAVGVTDPADLERISRQVASLGFTSGDQTKWAVEMVSGPDGRPRVARYDSEEEALSAGSADPGNFIKAEQFASEIALPTEQVPGLAMTRMETFAANRPVAEGVSAIEMARIIHKGKDVGPLLVPVSDIKRHTLIAASSGAGKTELIKYMSQKLGEYLYAQYGSGEVALEDHCSRIIIDVTKHDNYGPDFAAQLREAGLPDDMATVHVISPGDEGARPNINLLRPVGANTMAEQISLAMHSLSANIPDNYARFVFTKYGTMAIERAMEKVGWNPDTGKSKYPGQTPLLPTMETVMICIEEVITELEFQDKSLADLKGYTEGTLSNALRGIPGQLFKEGYDIDWDAIRRNKGVTVIELGRIKSLEGKRVALSAILRSLDSVLVGENKGNKDTNKLKMDVKIDETVGLFDEFVGAGQANSAAEELAYFFTQVRGHGMAVTIAQQDGISKIHSHVRGNIVNTWGLQINDPADMETMLGRMQAKDEAERTRFLRHVEAGGGLYHGINMPDGPAAFTTPAPVERQPANHLVSDSDSMLDRGHDLEFYESGLHTVAKKFLLEDEVGVLLRGAVELSTILTVTGREPVKISGELKSELQKMANGTESKMLDCAVTQAAEVSVKSRPQTLYAMDPRTLVAYVRDDLLAQVHGTPPPERAPFDLQFAGSRYSAIKDVVAHELAAKALDDTATYEAAFGEGTRIAGYTADEQLDTLRRTELGAIQIVTNAVVDAVQRKLEPDNLDIAVHQLQNLVGSAPLAQAAEQARKEMEIHWKRKMDPDEVAAFEFLADKLAERQVGSAEPVVGFPEMRSALLEAKTAAESQGAIDLSEWEALYGEEFSGETAAEQLENIKKKEQQAVAAAGYKINLTDLYFANDLLLGGHTLDNVTASMVENALPEGGLLSAQRRRLNDKKAPKYNLAEILLRDATQQVRDYNDQMAHNLLLSSSIGIPSVVARELVVNIQDIIQSAKTQNKQYATAKGSKK